ncbi:MAG: AmmeMemoRadiSam system protein A [Acetivibrionales bacterium]|jgi:AmmeMemoRadiSam system protein A
MGSVISSYVFPHPPIIVPEVGKGGEREAVGTLEAMKRAAGLIGEEKPTTIIITTPHGPLFQDYIYIPFSERLKGDFSGFRAGNVNMEFANNTDMARDICLYAREEGIYAGGLDDTIAKKYKISGELDHGVLVPMYFVSKVLKNFKLVRISVAGLPFNELYRFGMCISKAVDKSGERVVFIASGDLSHRLTHDAPYGFSEQGSMYDKLVVESLKEFNVKQLMQIDENMCESAGECGLRSFIIMFGAMDCYNVEPEVYSYEGPFGVGYAVARFNVLNRKTGGDVLKEVEEANAKMMEKARANEDIYVKLARSSLENYVKGKGIMKLPEDLPDEMVDNKAGAFVTIKKYGRLRGCIGTTAPTRENVAHEIIYNAISAGTQDPRFEPVEENELDELVYSVDILKEPEPIESMEQLDIKKYGVIVRSGFKSGLLLPDLEGVDTVEEQVRIALRKAGIRPGEKYRMERFEVVRHK